MDKLPPLKNDNGYALCSDGKYHCISDARFNAARGVIERLDKELRMYREANEWLRSEQARMGKANAVAAGANAAGGER